MIMSSQAVASLRPNAPFVLVGEDIAGITWYVDGVEPLTREQVDAEIIRLEQAEKDKQASDAIARDAAIAHAKSLGFTDAMIAVMYPNLGAQNE